MTTPPDGLRPGADGVLRHAEHVMGTVFSFTVRCPTDAGPATGSATAAVRAGLAAAVARLHELDRRFSPYLPDSELNRLADGRLDPAAAHPEIAWVAARCRETAAETDGWFSDRYRPGAPADPSGWVKGWAVAEASRLLTESGAVEHCVSGGGDVQTVGGPWRVGVVRPDDPARLAVVLAGRGLAVATSGSAERGDHVLDPRTGAPATGLASLTLVSPSAGIARTDAWATAAYAMGPELGLRWAHRRPEVEALAVLPDGTLRCTPGFPRHLADGAGTDPADWRLSPLS